MEWDQDLCIYLIGEYRKREILWNMRHSSYYNKVKKEDTWTELANILNRNSEEVKRKIESLKGSYRREKARIKKKAGSEDVYVSKWFAFGLLQFLDDKDDPQEETLSVFPDTWSYGQNSPVDQLPNKRRKEEFDSVGCSALSDSFPAPSNYLERSEDSKEFDAVGVNVAAKLKKMTSSQQIYAELLINKVLAKGLLNKLTEETDLSDF